MRYASFDAAARRADAIQRAYGAFPGVRGPFADGRYTLSWDPDDTGKGGDGREDRG